MQFEAFELLKTYIRLALRPMHLSCHLHRKALPALLNSQARAVSAVPDKFHQDLIDFQA